MCHPFRLVADGLYHKKNSKNLIVPLSNLSNELSKYFKNKNIINYGLRLTHRKKISILNDKCLLPYPLIIAYSLAFCFSLKPAKVFLIGFDGYKLDDTLNDQTQVILNFFKEIGYSKKIIFLSKIKLKNLK